MSDTSLPETAHTQPVHTVLDTAIQSVAPAPQADVSINAVRHDVPVPPEHRDAQADQINIHVSNTTHQATTPPASPPSPPHEVTPQEMKSAMESFLGKAGELSFQQPDGTHTAPSAANNAAGHDPLFVDVKKFKKAEKNFAEYFGQYLSDAHAGELGNGGLELEFENTLAIQPAADAAGALQISLIGPQIESNKVLAFHLLTCALQEHPVIGKLFAAKQENGEGMLAGPYSDGDVTRMNISVDALSYEQYAELINALAGAEHAQAVHTEEVSTPLIAAAAPSPVAIPHADAGIPGLTFEEPAQGAVKEHRVAHGTHHAATPDTAKTIPLGIAAEQAASQIVAPEHPGKTIPLLPAPEHHGTIGQMTLEQVKAQSAGVGAA